MLLVKSAALMAWSHRIDRKRAVERSSNSNHRRGYGTASASDNRL